MNAPNTLLDRYDNLCRDTRTGVTLSSRREPIAETLHRLLAECELPPDATEWLSFQGLALCLQSRRGR